MKIIRLNENHPVFPFARSGERTRKKRRFVSDKPMVCVIRPMFHTLQEVLLMYVSRFHGLSTAWFWIECCERCTLHGCFTSPFEWRMRDVPFGTGSVRFWYILCTILPYCVKHVRVWKEGMFHNILLKINKMKDGESVKLSPGEKSLWVVQSSSLRCWSPSLRT